MRAKKKFERFWPIVIWALIAVFLHIPASSAQEGSNEEAFSSPLELLAGHDIHVIPGLKNLFSEIRNASSLGDRQKITRGVSGIIKLKKELDTNNLFPVSDLLILEADRMALLGNFDIALALIDGAGQISPDYGRVDFRKATILLQQSPLNILPFFSGLSAVLHKTFKSQAQWSEWGQKIISTGLLVVAFSFLLFFLFLFLFNIRPLFYDLRSFTPFTYEKTPTQIFAIALLMLPAAIGGLKLFLLVLPVFLWGYIGPRARVIVVLFFLYLAFIFPQLLKDLSRSIVFSNSSVFHSLERVSQGNWDNETLHRLLRELDKEKPTPDVYFGLGYIYKKKKDYPQAIYNYEKYLQFYPDDPLTLSNLGATSMEMGKIQAAVDYFQKALKKQPDLFEAHLNLNLSYMDKEILDTKNAKMEYDKAVLLNHARTKKFMEENAHGAGRGNLDCLLSRERIDNYLMGLDPMIDEIHQSLWRATIGPIPMGSLFYYLVGAVIILLGLYYYHKKSGFSQICVSCGMVFIDPLQISTFAREKCYQCSAAFSRKQIIDPKKKKELQWKVASYRDSRKKIRILSNLLFPGAGYLFSGRELAGFVFMALNSLFLVAIGLAFLKTTGSGISVSQFVTSNVFLMGITTGYYLVSTFIFLLSKGRD